MRNPVPPVLAQSPARTDAFRGHAALADAEAMFEAAPISLWLEDYSALKDLFRRWRAAGIADLRAFLLEDPQRVTACSQSIRVLAVNAATLTLFGARTAQHLVDNLDAVFRADMLKTFVGELVQLWQGNPSFNSTTVNYSLDGRRMDIQLKGTVLRGHEDAWDRVLVAIEDVTERETALQRLAVSDSYARGLFEHSPVSLWVEDFSEVRLMLEDLRARGIEDFRTFTDVHPEFVARCIGAIRVLEVNRHTLEMFGASSKEDLLRRMADVFLEGAQHHFREQLVDLWSGKLFQRREIVNYTLDGAELHLHMQFSILPGHEQDWSLVQVALTDISARKKAEAYLEFLGRHDVLTKLFNRTCYSQELEQLERRRVEPVTIIMADLNGLKAANDANGHAAGDALLRRAGEVLAKAIDTRSTAARIGGDEFALVLPHAHVADGQAVLNSLASIIDLNNQFHSGLPLSLSVGMATSEPGERLEAVARRADLAMYKAKRRFHQGRSRRR